RTLRHHHQTPERTGKAQQTSVSSRFHVPANAQRKVRGGRNLRPPPKAQVFFGATLRLYRARRHHGRHHSEHSPRHPGQPLRRARIHQAARNTRHAQETRAKAHSTRKSHPGTRPGDHRSLRSHPRTNEPSPKTIPPHRLSLLTFPIPILQGKSFAME